MFHVPTGWVRNTPGNTSKYQPQVGPRTGELHDPNRDRDGTKTGKVQSVCVFITAGPTTKLFAWGGGILKDKDPQLHLRILMREDRKNVPGSCTAGVNLPEHCEHGHCPNRI